jgi:hypothetical protein
MPRRFSLVLIAALLLPATARAIVVLPKGSTKPVLGYLVREDDRTVVVREELPDGKTREQSFPKADIDELIVTVSPERLAELDPAQPQLYREYAEELAEKHRDPEARDMALRLYHIAAVLGDGQLRRGSLLGLAALARSPAEERRFRAAAYLYDPEHNASLMIGEGDAKLGGSPAIAEPLKELLTAVRMARQDRGSQARAIIERPPNRAALAGLAKIITYDELLAACTARLQSDEQLYKLLQAEAALEQSLGERGSSATGSELVPQPTSWTAAVKSNGLAPLLSLELDTLTEFDPRACLYRDGKWTRP